MRDPPPELRFPAYHPPGWLRGAHAQTIWPTFIKVPPSPLRRERVEIGDGDFWDFDWLDMPAPADAPLCVVFHGLESNSDAHYARAMFAHLGELGWRGVVPHFRGCSGEPNRLPRAYHSGDHAEVEAMLAAVRARVAPDTTIFATGVSLGGSALLNWLGRAGPAAARTVSAAAAVSTPLDLYAAGVSIAQGMNMFYTRYFLRYLKPKALAMAERFPGLLDPARVKDVRTMWEFDDLVTSPLHGFQGTADYWSRGSSKLWLRTVAVPTLVLNARNDPFIPAESLPGPDDVGAAVTLEQPAGGGHAGFLSGRAPGHLRWLPQRIAHFFVHGV